MKDHSKTPQTPTVIQVPKSLVRTAQVTQALSTTLAASLAWRWFLTPFKFKIPKREIPFEGIFDGPEYITHERGLTYPMYTLGQGQRKILLVHGWAGRFSQLGEIIENLEDAKPDLLEEYTIIGFNALAHRGAEGKRTMMPEVARCVAELANIHGGFDAVIAHSLGANAVLYAKQELHAAIKKQVLIAPPGRISAMVHLFCDTIGFNDKVKERMIWVMKSKFGEDFDRHSAPELAKTNIVDTLVFHDLNDNDTPIELGREVGKNMQCGRYIETKGLGHRRILRDKTVAKEIADFLF